MDLLKNQNLIQFKNRFNISLIDNWTINQNMSLQMDLLTKDLNPALQNRIIIFDNWTINQNVSLEINNNLLKVTSNQDGSTPGIKYIETIDVESNSYYTLVIDGYKDCDCQVYPYIKDNNNNKIIWIGYNNNLIYTNSNNGLTREIDNKSIFIINIPENTSSLKLYLLFSDPQINDKFFINDITFYKDVLNENINISKNYILLNDTYSISLDNQPSSEVTISITSNNDITINQNTVVFTPSNWNEIQNINVNSDSYAIINHISSSDDEDFNNFSQKLYVTKIDIIISKSTLNIIEGNNQTYSIHLSDKPINDIIINMINTDDYINIIPSQIQFSSENWDQDVNIQVSVSINSNEDDYNTSIIHRMSSSDFEYEYIDINRISVDINDSYKVNLSTNNLNINKGETAGYSIVLNADPQTIVLISAEYNNDNLELYPLNNKGDAPVLAFNSNTWDIPQTIIIKSINDNIKNGDHLITISHLITSDNTNYDLEIVNDINLNIIDTNITSVVLSTNSLKLLSGVDKVYYIKLNSIPLYDVNINLNTSDDINLNINQVVFNENNWDEMKKIIVSHSGNSDNYIISHIASSNDLNYNNIEISDINITIEDNDVEDNKSVMVSDYNLNPVNNPVNIDIINKLQVRKFNISLTHEPYYNVKLEMSSLSDIYITTNIKDTSLYNTWSTNPQKLIINFDVGTWNIPIIIYIVTKLNIDFDITKNIIFNLSSDDLNYNNMNLLPIILNIKKEKYPSYLMHTLPLEGYLDKRSYYPGDNVSVMVNQPRTENVDAYYSDLYNNRLFNLEILDKMKNSLLNFQNIEGKQQIYKANAFAEGCDWEECFNFEIPNNYSSDIYFIRLYDDTDEYYIPLIIKNNLQSDILVLVNTNTWEAYNDWAGLDGKASLYKWEIYEEYNKTAYKYKGDHYSNFVSYNRPNPINSFEIKTFNFLYSNYQSHKLVGELFLLKWLTDNNYTYNIITDTDLHNNPLILNQYKIFILNCHPEYWTFDMIKGLYNYIDNSGQVMYLAGNGLYWKTVVNENQIEVQKNANRHELNNELGGKWINLQDEIYPLPSSEKIIGQWYDSSSYDIQNSYPYEISDLNHWIFTDVNTENNLIGTDTLNSKFGYTHKGASGWEVDMSYIDKQYTIAKGKPPSDDITHNNDMIYYETEKNGKMFSVGSLTYTGSLLVDNNISQITKNVLDYYIESNVQNNTSSIRVSNTNHSNNKLSYYLKSSK